MSLAPKNAKRVFHGTVFDIYQWKQKMFNKTYRTFESAKILGGASIIAEYEGKIVILKQQQPRTKWYYTLPGGYLDHPNENPKQAAERELLEETGLKPKKIKLWKTFDHSGRVESRFYVYIAQGCEKVAKPRLDGGERIKIELRTFEQFLKMTEESSFNHKDVIIEILRARLVPVKKAGLKKLIFG